MHPDDGDNVITCARHDDHRESVFVLIVSVVFMLIQRVGQHSDVVIEIQLTGPGECPGGVLSIRRRSSRQEWVAHRA